MDLHSHKLWTVDGNPGENTSEILSTLRSVLLRWPDHIGANHLLIHVVEASPNPSQGLASARRLQTLAAGAGHLVHMPAHIYFRIGDYTSAMRSTRDAAATDDAYLESGGNSNAPYRIAYADHNLRLFVAAASMAGDFQDAYDVANHLHQSAATYAANFPVGEDYLAVRILLLVRFDRWSDVLSSPQPSSKFTKLTFYWHYARGCAFAALRQAEQARVESAAMEDTYDIMETRASHALPAEMVNENTIAVESLEARVASARGDEAETIAHYRLAVAAEDFLNYHEPPLWYYPVRESLGAALFRDRQMKEAEKVFRKDLLINPNNPRSLYGLWKVLESVHNANAGVIGGEFKRAWKGRTSELTFPNF
jgi:tetratricopeptide (TPR) repeat protein